jgi:hypothetical protein
MATLYRTRLKLACALTFAVLAIAPALASAAPQWQQLPDPPGGAAIALVSGVPYVAYASPAGVRVARPTPKGDAWRQVGGPIRHASGSAVYDPTIAQAPDKHLWVAWTEVDASNVRQARVARLDGKVWHEVVGGPRPINQNIDPSQWPATSAYEPVIGFFGGSVYVAYTQDTPVDYVLGVVRLKRDGSAFERLDPPPQNRLQHPRIAVSGGRLYVAAAETLGPGTYVVRLNASGTGWDPRFNEPSGDEFAYFGDIADIGGSLGVLFARYQSYDLDVSSLGADGTWAPVGPGPVATSDSGRFDPQSLVAPGGVPYAAWLDGAAAPHSVQVAVLQGGAWVRLPSPSAAGTDAQLARLAASSKGVYVMWTDAAATHVARLGDRRRHPHPRPHPRRAHA